MFQKETLQRWKVLGSIFILLWQGIIQGQSDGVTVFLSMTLDHECDVGDLTNQNYNYVRKPDDVCQEFSKKNINQLINATSEPSFSDNLIQDGPADCSLDPLAENHCQPCQNFKFKNDPSSLESSIHSEFNLVCHNQYVNFEFPSSDNQIFGTFKLDKASLTKSLKFAGGCFSFLMTSLADKYDRKNAIIILNIILAILVFISSFAQNWWIFGVLRFFETVVLRAAFISALALIMEFADYFDGGGCDMMHQSDQNKQNTEVAAESESSIQDETDLTDVSSCDNDSGTGIETSKLVMTLQNADSVHGPTKLTSKNENSKSSKKSCRITPIIGYVYMYSWSIGVLFSIFVSSYFRQWRTIIRVLGSVIVLVIGMTTYVPKLPVDHRYSIVSYVPKYHSSKAEEATEGEEHNESKYETGHNDTSNKSVDVHFPIEEEQSTFKKILNSSWRFKTILFLTGLINFCSALLCINYIVNRLMPNLSVFTEKTIVQMAMLPGLLLSIVLSKKFGTRRCMIVLLVIFMVNDFFRIVVEKSMGQQELAEQQIGSELRNQNNQNDQTQNYITKSSLKLLTLSIGYMTTIWIWNSVFVLCNELFPKTIKATAVSIQDTVGIIGCIIAPLLAQAEKNELVHMTDQNNLSIWSSSIQDFSNIFIATLLILILVKLPDSKKAEKMFEGMEEAEEFYKKEFRVI